MELIVNYNNNYNSQNNSNNNNSIESSQTLSTIFLGSSVHPNQTMKRSTGSKPQQQQQQLQQFQQLQEQEQQHQISADCLKTVESPKPNQVGTVLLYGIPIVSLYIESQERLCLAQISNTLLKTFSYNEIHNRRVALGITCVQCTPVQLEILRRAGAMPVSSRRCGMITRREAERLCKSFLGDNAPPRLPDDFAFSVHHECAWGCRGSFLPSRYNSSRAKCIKCSYCGLFFSPNKFIFHSHRIGPSDKYVQPDAANFNSWRRHMKLSGNPPEEITHAWEDVKAMFNGGTRKRLLTNSPTTSSTSHNTPSPPKRLKENELSQPLIHAAVAAAAAATANVSQFPVHPLNIHPHHQHSATSISPGTASTNSHSRIPTIVGPTAAAAATAAELSSLPFSRNFMMDYMWHAHQNKPNSFPFPNYALPFIKRPTGALIFSASNSNSNSAVRNPQLPSISTTNERLSTPNSCNNDDGPSLPNYDSSFSLQNESKSLSSFYSNSAFKPVIQAGIRSTIAFPSPTDLTIAAAAVAAVAASAAGSGSHGKSHGGSITSLDDDQRTISHDGDFFSNCDSNNLTKIKECLSSDDEMVDIETTEEEKPQHTIMPSTSETRSINIIPLTCTRLKKNNSDSALLSSINIKLPDSPPIEIENSNDCIAWDGIMKKERAIDKSNGNSSNFRSVTPEPSLVSHSPASSLASGDSHQATNISALNISSINNNNNNNNNSNTNNNNNNNISNNNSSPLQVTCQVSPINDENKLQPTTKLLNHLTTTTTTTVTSATAVAIASAFGNHHHQQHHPAMIHHNHLPGHNHLQNLHSTHQHHRHHHFQQSGGGHLSSNDTPSPSDNRICNSSSCNNSNNNNNNNNRSPNNTNISLIINNSSNNTNLSSNAIFPNATNSSINNSNSAEFWSVARLSFDRQNDYHRVPSFYRHHHDITKHFQSFRYHGHETTTQTNGIG